MRNAEEKVGLTADLHTRGQTPAPSCAQASVFKDLPEGGEFGRQIIGKYLPPETIVEITEELDGGAEAASCLGMNEELEVLRNGNPVVSKDTTKRFART